MNKDRRKSLATLHSELDDLKGKLDDIQSQVESLKDEEQDCFDNMPESLQGGDKGSAAETVIEQLDAAYDSLANAISEVEDAMSSVDEASQ